MSANDVHEVRDRPLDPELVQQWAMNEQDFFERGTIRQARRGSMGSMPVRLSFGHGTPSAPKHSLRLNKTTCFFFFF